MLPLNHVLQNRYRILRPLGKGGMGHVYEAMDDAVDCIVAIKETFAATDKLRRAFEREAKLLANLRHPVLPRVTHHFLEGDGQFLSMDYVEGLNLLELLALRKQPFRQEEVLPEAEKLLSALHYLHTRSEPIIHRDIKPANIKRTSDGEIYLLDFGLAKGSAGQMSTMDPGESFFSSVYGYTAAYAPLEQLTNAGTNAQSDLYGLGATLYHLLTGQAPISANVRYEALEMDAADPLPKVHQLNPQVSADVSGVISRAMEMSRRDRLRSAQEMIEGLRAAKEKAREAATVQLSGASLPGVTERAPQEVPSERTEKAIPTLVLPNATPAGIASPPWPPGQADQSPFNVPPAVTTPSQPDSKPSAEVSWPSQINTSDSQAAQSTGEVAPGATQAAPTNFAQSGSAFSSHEAQVKTLVADRPSAAEPVWTTPQVSTPTLPERRSSTLAKILIISGIVAMFLGAVLWVYLSTTERTEKTNTNTTTPDSEISKTRTAGPRTFSYQRDLQSNAGVVWSVAWSSGGTFVATAGDDQRVRFYEGPSLKLTDSEWFHPGVINSIATSPTGKAIACASNNKTVTLRTGGVNTVLKGHTDEVYFVTYSPDGKIVASASKDKTVRVWDTQSGTELHILSGHTDVVWSVAFSPDGSLLATASKDKTIKIWDARNWTPIRTLTGHQSAVISLAFSPSGSFLASGGDDNTIKFWDTMNLSEVRVLNGHTSYVTSLAFSPDGQTLASASNDQTVRLWNTQTGETRQVLTGHTKGVTSVSFSPDGKTLITGGRDQTVKVWQ
ncbi:MAG: protein kinase [Acidobacteriota bacterium]